MKETSTHVYFWGGIYSNWYPAKFSDSERSYNCAEQYMMYKKAMEFGDQVSAGKILNSLDPKTQKALGRKVKGFDPLKWDLVKLKIVVEAISLKFSQNPKLKKQLLATGDKILVEGSPYDKVWGVGLKWDDPLIEDETNWKGQNLLGAALMIVRDVKFLDIKN